jgi:hypothetical protein
MSKRRLHEVLGLPDPERSHRDDPELVTRALEFRIAGGVIGLADWDVASPKERQALVEAGRQLLALQREAPEVVAPRWTPTEDPERAFARRAKGLRALCQALSRPEDEVRQELALLGLGGLTDEVAEGRMTVGEAVARLGACRLHQQQAVDRIEQLRAKHERFVAL